MKHKPFFGQGQGWNDPIPSELQLLCIKIWVCVPDGQFLLGSHIQGQEGSRQTNFCGTILVFRAGLRWEWGVDFPAGFLSCSSTRRGSRLTCLIVSRCTTTRAPLSVSTVAPSCGAWQGRGWSVMVSPQQRGSLSLEGGSQKIQISFVALLCKTSMRWHPGGWRSGLHGDHSSRMGTTVHVTRDVWSRRMMSCFPKRQRTSQWHSYLPKSAPVSICKLDFHSQTQDILLSL